MKALILAAGLGTRLRPLTNTTPKPLLPIGDKPLLYYHLDQLLRCGVTNVLINTHYLSEQIDSFVRDYQASHSKINISTAFESTLLGSAGTVLANRDFFLNTNDFLIVYGDNLTDINYQKIFSYHLEGTTPVTIATYRESKPEEKGIIECDESNIITRFIEKPKAGETMSNLANAGVYVLNQSIFSILNELNHNELLDFGYHVFPYLLKRGIPMRIYHMNETILDIGTPENYTLAQVLLKNLDLE